MTLNSARAASGRGSADARAVRASMARPRAGLEHEFRVSSARGAVDFRGIIHGLGLGQRHLDPVDPNAYRLPSGVAITCDGPEAELALPPNDLAPGFGHSIASHAYEATLMLRDRLPADIALTGVSTHLSVSVSDAHLLDVARNYAATFAPALMLLMDRRDSPGLLVRPRPGRLEVGGEYVTGDQLVAATVFAVGSCLATHGAMTSGSGAGALPARIDARIDPAVERYGWYVDRRAFGVDLYSEGRRARLRRFSGESVTAQTHLEECWGIARRALDGIAGPDEIALVDDVVAGARPIPLESPLRDATLPTGESHRDAENAFGAALRPRQRIFFSAAVVMVTWDTVAFLLVARGSGARRFAVVPGEQLETFLAALDHGDLDREIAAAFARRPAVLGSWRELEGIGYYAALGPRVNLVRPERGPDGAPLDDAGAAVLQPRPPRWSPRHVMPRLFAAWQPRANVTRADVPFPPSSPAYASHFDG